MPPPCPRAAPRPVVRCRLRCRQLEPSRTRRGEKSSFRPPGTRRPQCTASRDDETLATSGLQNAPVGSSCFSSRQSRSTIQRRLASRTSSSSVVSAGRSANQIPAARFRWTLICDTRRCPTPILRFPSPQREPGGRPARDAETGRGGSGVGSERFFRTLKEQLLRVRDFTTLEELAGALEEFHQRYNDHWLLKKAQLPIPAAGPARGCLP